MNRRSFLSGLAALVGGVVLNEAIPLGRVWSFPKEIVIYESEWAKFAQFTLEPNMYIMPFEWPGKVSLAPYRNPMQLIANEFIMKQSAYWPPS